MNYSWNSKSFKSINFLLWNSVFLFPCFHWLFCNCLLLCFSTSWIWFFGSCLAIAHLLCFGRRTFQSMDFAYKIWKFHFFRVLYLTLVKTQINSFKISFNFRYYNGFGGCCIGCCTLFKNIILCVFVLWRDVTKWVVKILVETNFSGTLFSDFVDIVGLYSAM